MDKEKQRRAFEGLALINLITRTKQTEYCGRNGVNLASLEERYRKKLSEIKLKLFGEM